MSPELIIDTVKISLRTGEIEEINVNGRTDIFEHDEVERYTEDKDGKIIKIGGEFEYGNNRFNFTVGYSKESGVDLGRISVKKQGRRTGDLGAREEAFEFLENIYDDYFVDV